MKTIKKIPIITLLILSFSLYLFSNDNILIKKWFRDKNTYVIVCKGFPKEELSGKKKIESAKEAALINAQFIARNIFKNSVDAVKNGSIQKYKKYKAYVVIYYVIKKRDLRRRLRKKR